MKNENSEKRKLFDVTVVWQGKMVYTVAAEDIVEAKKIALVLHDQMDATALLEESESSIDWVSEHRS